MSDSWDDEWEEAHFDCTPEKCKLFGSTYCQTGCVLRWEWEDEEEDECLIDTSNQEVEKP